MIDMEPSAMFWRPLETVPDTGGTVDAGGTAHGGGGSTSFPPALMYVLYMLSRWCVCVVPVWWRGVWEEMLVENFT